MKHLERLGAFARTFLIDCNRSWIKLVQDGLAEWSKALAQGASPRRVGSSHAGVTFQSAEASSAAR